MAGLTIMIYKEGAATALLGPDATRYLRTALFLLRDREVRPLNAAAADLKLAPDGPLAALMRTAANGGTVEDFYGADDDAPDAPRFLVRAHPVARDGSDGAVLVEVMDASAAHAVETALRRQVCTDSLTGVANRRHFLDEATRKLAEARRHRVGLCVLMLDLDRFKRINDRYGHAAGDRVLIEACQAWNGSMRRSDLLGRLGGEEFAVLVSHAEVLGVRRVAERLRGDLAPLEKRLGLDRPVTVSIGGAMLRVGDDLDDLLVRADNALYAAKRGGRDRFVLCAAEPV